MPSKNKFSDFIADEDWQHLDKEVRFELKIGNIKPYLCPDGKYETFDPFPVRGNRVDAFKWLADQQEKTFEKLLNEANEEIARWHKSGGEVKDKPLTYYSCTHLNEASETPELIIPIETGIPIT